MSGNLRVVVIGAGMGGLAAAALLAGRGSDVTVVERRNSIGGRASVWESGGYRFDMGPSWYLMPDIFERFFAELGDSPSNHYALQRLDPSYRIFYGPGDYLEMSADMDANLERFEEIEAGASGKFREYLQTAKLQYEVSVSKFLYREIRSLSDFLDRDIAKAGGSLRVFENLDRYTRRYFQNDRLRKVLEYSMVFLGGAPTNTPALYSMLAHVDFNLGVWYPKGGLGTVARSLERVAVQRGANIVTDCEATAIVVRDSRVAAVITSKGEIPTDIVLANADYPHVETRLLERRQQSYPESYWRKRTLAPSAVMMYLGVDRPISTLAHHSLSFEHDWVDHFNSIFRHPAWPTKPSFYFCCPTKTDPGVAPQGCENLVTLVPVAPGLVDTDEARENMCEMTLDCLTRLSGVDIRPHIRVKRVFSHRDYASEYNAYRGTALGLSHTLLQSAMFRPRLSSRKVRGLYYVGQYTHPGIGVPMALISATVVSELIRKECPE